MDAQKVIGKKSPSFALTATASAITATALMGTMYWSSSRYPSTDFSQPMLEKTDRATQTLLGDSSWIYTVAIAPDGQTVVSGNHGGKINMWHLPTGGLTRTIDAHPSAISSLAISPDGETLVSGSWDDCIKIWNLRSGQLTRTINAYADDVKAVAISPDGQTVAAGTYSGVIKLWNLKTGKQVGQFKHSGPVTSLAISLDKRLASGSRNGKIKIWELESGWELTIDGHKKAVWAIAFSPDGHTLASGSHDRTVKLWQVETNKLISTFERHSNAVYSVAFSPDGQKIASGSYDRQIRLWQVETEKLLETFAGHGKAVWSLEFTPDGQKLVSGSADETLKVWSVPAASGDVVLESIKLSEAENHKQEFLSESEKIETNAVTETTAAKISSLGQLEELNQSLYDRLDRNWRETPQWHGDLVYRVRVNGNGAIVNYEPANQEAKDYLAQTPLSQLVNATDNEAGENGPEQFPLFRVVMTSEGTLEVSPWQGWTRIIDNHK